VKTLPVLPTEVASTETSMLETVLQYGTGKAAAIGQFAAGKTGTTSNYGDAWFVGWDSKYTVAVWVGFPNNLVPMTTDFDGGPVLGGTYPALIWHDFMISALQIEKERAEHSASSGRKTTAGEAISPSTTTPSVGTAGSAAAPSSKTASPTAPSSTKGGPPTPSSTKQEATGETHGAEHAATPSTPPAAEQPAATTTPATTTPSATGGVGAPGG
jgi:penicillin-binding protein 1A